jgi:alpha-mannosidase
MNRIDQFKQTLVSLESLESQSAKRFLAEMEFAEGLAQLEGKTKAWGKLIDQAWEIVENGWHGDVVCRHEPAAQPDQHGDKQRRHATRTFADLDQAVAQAEQVLAPIGKAAKGYTIHCVGHAHIDMNWMWTWAETVHTTNDTFRTMLKLMEEFPDFTFAQSQASVYELIGRYNPAMLAEIARRVKEGRWEVVASHWVEGDKNTVSGESLARHLLYTRQFMKEAFDLSPEDILVDWSPDTFGHAHSIPSIDARGGVRRYYCCRGGTYWVKPPVFWFQGPDGSRVLVNFETTWYSDTISPHNGRALLNFAKKTGLKDWMCVYGVGDHGGGPTRRDIARMHEMNDWPIYPTYRFSRTDTFFEILEQHGDRWPVLDRELNFECDGCYTSQSEIKKCNRLGEIYCVEAEWAGVLGWRAGGLEYPAQTLRENWQEVLFTHFHDILPGSGVPATRQYSQGMFQKVAAATSMIKSHAFRAVAAKVKTDFVPPPPAPATAELTSMADAAGVGCPTAGGGVSAASTTADLPRPFVVFNQLGQARREVVVATVWDPQGAPGTTRYYAVRTADGREIPAQKTGQGVAWSQKFIELAFPAEIGSLGYNTFVIVDAGEEYVRPPTSYNYNYELLYEPPYAEGVKTAPVNPNWVQMAPRFEQFTMENEHLRVEFDLATGGVKTLLDKASGLNLASAAEPLGVVEYAVERPGPMTAWVTYAPSSRAAAPVVSVTRGLIGPYIGSVIVKARAGGSEVTVTYSLKAGQRWLDIDVSTRWMEVGSPSVGVPKLLMKFPLAVRDAKASYEIPFGSIQREENAGQEVPALRWADVSGVACPSLRGHGAQGDSNKSGGPAGLALLNDCKHGHSLDGSTLRLTLLRSSHDPDPLPEIGDHTMRMAVVPHGKSPARAELMELAAAFNQPLQVVATDPHDGEFAAAQSAAQVQGAGVVLTSVKQAQDGNGVVFRLLETEGKAAMAKVKINPQLLGKPGQAVEVDLLERPVAKSSAKAGKEGFTVSLAPHAIVSVKVALDA